MSKRLFIALGAIIIAVTLFQLLNHLGFNRGNSVDFRFYIHKPFNDELKRDEYYIVKYKGHNFEGFITKKAVCLPGDKLSRENNTFFCNGQEIGRIEITHNINSVEYQQYSPPETGQILNGEVFFIGDALYSYDSRYFGPLPISSIKREVSYRW